MLASGDACQSARCPALPFLTQPPLPPRPATPTPPRHPLHSLPSIGGRRRSRAPRPTWEPRCTWRPVRPCRPCLNCVIQSPCVAAVCGAFGACARPWPLHLALAHRGVPCCTALYPLLRPAGRPAELLENRQTHDSYDPGALLPPTGGGGGSAAAAAAAGAAGGGGGGGSAASSRRSHLNTVLAAPLLH